MKHYASPSFWKCYDNLPDDIKELADKNYQLLKQNLNHLLLHFKKIQNYFSVRVGIKHGALGVEIDKMFCGFGLEIMLNMTNLYHINLK